MAAALAQQRIQDAFQNGEPVLDLMNFGLTEMPPVPYNMTHTFGAIHLDGNQLTETPDLRNFINLQIFTAHGCPIRRIGRLPNLPMHSMMFHIDAEDLEEPFLSYYIQYIDNPFSADTYRTFKNQVNSFWDAEDRRRAAFASAQRNLGSFQTAITSPAQTPANWYAGPEELPRALQIPGLNTTIASFLSGEEGTFPQQRVKVQEKLTRPLGGPGVGTARRRKGRRSTRRNRRSRK